MSLPTIGLADLRSFIKEVDDLKKKPVERSRSPSPSGSRSPSPSGSRSPSPSGSRSPSPSGSRSPSPSGSRSPSSPRRKSSSPPRSRSPSSPRSRSPSSPRSRSPRTMSRRESPPRTMSRRGIPPRRRSPSPEKKDSKVILVDLSKYEDEMNRNFRVYEKRDSDEYSGITWIDVDGKRVYIVIEGGYWKKVQYNPMYEEEGKETGFVLIEVDSRDQETFMPIDDYLKDNYLISLLDEKIRNGPLNTLVPYDSNVYGEIYDLEADYILYLFNPPNKDVKENDHTKSFRRFLKDHIPDSKKVDIHMSRIILANLLMMKAMVEDLQKETLLVLECIKEGKENIVFPKKEELDVGYFDICPIVAEYARFLDDQFNDPIDYYRDYSKDPQIVLESLNGQLQDIDSLGSILSSVIKSYEK